MSEEVHVDHVDAAPAVAEVHTETHVDPPHVEAPHVETSPASPVATAAPAVEPPHAETAPVAAAQAETHETAAEEFKQPAPHPMHAAEFRTINAPVTGLWILGASAGEVQKVAVAIKAKARELGVASDGAEPYKMDPENPLSTFTNSVLDTLQWVEHVKLPKAAVTPSEAAAGQRPDHPVVVEKRQEYFDAFKRLLATVEARFGKD